MREESFLQKNRTKILIVAAIFIFVFFVIFLISLLSPQKNRNGEANETPTPTPVTNTIPPNVIVPTAAIQQSPGIVINRLGDVTFGPFTKTFPTQINLYSFVNTQVDPQSAQKIAQNLGISSRGTSTQTIDGPAINYQDGDKNLLIYLSLGSVQYFGGQESNETVKNLPDAINIAQEAIKKLSPYSSGLLVDEPSIQYFSGTGDLNEENSFSGANIYSIPFVQKINSLPVYAQLGNIATATVWVNKNGGVQRITFLAPGALTAAQNKNLLSLSEAKAKIARGEGTISSYGPSNEYGTFPVPDKTFLNSVDMGYLLDSKNKILYPIFVFKGTSTTEGSGPLPITVYLPASK